MVSYDELIWDDIPQGHTTTSAKNHSSTRTQKNKSSKDPSSNITWHGAGHRLTQVHVAVAENVSSAGNVPRSLAALEAANAWNLT